MKKYVSLFILILILISASQAQDNLWRTLANVSFTKIMDNDLGYELKFPVFNEEIRALDGKEVTIKGYIIPLEEDLGYFAFSAFPFANCFFCGNAGIETVMEVYAPDEIDYTPKAIKLKGRLELNEDNMMDHLMYILKDAKQVKD